MFSSWSANLASLFEPRCPFPERLDLRAEPGLACTLNQSSYPEEKKISEIKCFLIREGATNAVGEMVAAASVYSSLKGKGSIVP